MALGAERVRVSRRKPEPLVGGTGLLRGVAMFGSRQTSYETTLKGCGLFVCPGLGQVEWVLQMAAEMRRRLFVGEESILVTAHFLVVDNELPS